MAEKALRETTGEDREMNSPLDSVVTVARVSEVNTPVQDGRSELIRKHNKHINDLKTYYIRELEHVNERIRLLEQSRPTIATSLQQQSKCEGERTVYQLQEQLRDTCSQLTDHVTQLGVANKMVSVLQEQLAVSRRGQAEMKSELLQVSEENNLLHDSLRNIRQELDDNKTSQLQRMEHLLSELEHAQQDYQRIKERHDRMNEELLVAHREHSDMSATLAKMEQQRMDDQSTIQSLEDELSRLQLTSNRNFSMSTHHSLANSYISPQSRVSMRTSPQYRGSPLKLRGSPSPPSRAIPLTRRKWLEQSDASLISGIGPSYDHSPTSPVHNTSLDDTLRAVRTGDVTSYGPEFQQRLELKARANLLEVSKAQDDFASLQEQRKQLEATLQKIPATGRVTMEMKQKRLHTEEQLDHVFKEIGRVRMLLRNHHALKSTA